jgi:hypothetical protein
VQIPTPLPVRIELDAKHNDEYREGKESRSAQLRIAKLLNWITAIGVVGAFVYAGITYLQWRDLQHNFEADERAWIAFNFAFDSERKFSEGHTMTPGKMFDGNVVMRFENSGKSPILRTEVHTWVEILDHNATPTFSLDTIHPIGRFGPIFPGKFMDANIRRHNPRDGSEFNPTDRELDDLKEGRDYVGIRNLRRYFWISWGEVLRVVALYRHRPQPYDYHPLH